MARADACVVVLARAGVCARQNHSFMLRAALKALAVRLTRWLHLRKLKGQHPILMKRVTPVMLASEKLKRYPAFMYCRSISTNDFMETHEECTLCAERVYNAYCIHVKERGHEQDEEMLALTCMWIAVKFQIDYTDMDASFLAMIVDRNDSNLDFVALEGVVLEQLGWNVMSWIEG